MRLSRALSDLVKYTKSVRVHDIETQGKGSSKSTPSLKYLHIFINCIFDASFLSGSICKQLAGVVPQ